MNFCLLPDGRNTGYSRKCHWIFLQWLLYIIMVFVKRFYYVSAWGGCVTMERMFINGIKMGFFLLILPASKANHMRWMAVVTPTFCPKATFTPDARPTPDQCRSIFMAWSGMIGYKITRSDWRAYLSPINTRCTRAVSLMHPRSNPALPDLPPSFRLTNPRSARPTPDLFLM